MKDLGSWSDYHLGPEDDEIVGYDWRGQELYGHETGVMIDGEFVPEDDIMDYIEGEYGIVVAGEVMNNDYRGL